MELLFPKNSIDTHAKRSWCVFSHFDPNNRIEPYVLLYLAELKRCGWSTILVSTSGSLDEASINSVKQVTAAIILRENIGHDFGSYKAGIDHLFGQHASIDRLLLANDSIFGPFFGLDDIFAQSNRYDIYGLTDSYQIGYHLQSYFLLYNRKVVDNPCFRDFWNSVQLIDPKTPDSKRLIIRNYEVGGSQFFVDKGYSLGAAFPFTKVLPHAVRRYAEYLEFSKRKPGFNINHIHIKVNPTQSFWRSLIEMGFPFIKRDLLLINPYSTDVSDWTHTVQRHSNFDLAIVLKAMKNYSGNDDFFFLRQPDRVADQISDDGVIQLSINPSMKPWQHQFNVPDTRIFRFDEEAYLGKCPDAKEAVRKGAFSSGLDHFREVGHKESRPTPLVAIPDNEFGHIASSRTNPTL